MVILTYPTPIIIIAILSWSLNKTVKKYRLKKIITPKLDKRYPNTFLIINLFFLYALILNRFIDRILGINTLNIDIANRFINIIMIL